MLGLITTFIQEPDEPREPSMIHWEPYKSKPNDPQPITLTEMKIQHFIGQTLIDNRNLKQNIIFNFIPILDLISIITNDYLSPWVVCDELTFIRASTFTFWKINIIDKTAFVTLGSLSNTSYPHLHQYESFDYVDDHQLQSDATKSIEILRNSGFQPTICKF